MRTLALNSADAAACNQSPALVAILQPEPMLLCPGDGQSISQAVHAARIAAGFAACRQCEFNANSVGSEKAVFSADHASRVGRWLVKTIQASLGKDSSASAPQIAVASDGRPIAGEHLAAAIQGVRRAGGEALAVGPTSAPQLLATLGSTSAAGAVYVGNMIGEAHTLSVRAWQRNFTSHPTITPSAEELDTACGAEDAFGDDRHRSLYGGLQAAVFCPAYVDGLRPYYHALRPLKIVLDCRCPPVLELLRELSQAVACRWLPLKMSTPAALPARDIAVVDGSLQMRQVLRRRSLAHQVVVERAHLGMAIEHDGQKLIVVDEQSAAIAAESLATVLHATFGDEAVGVETDALRALTLLISLLSQSDRPLSQVFAG